MESTSTTVIGESKHLESISITVIGESTCLESISITVIGESKYLESISITVIGESKSLESIKTKENNRQMEYPYVRKRYNGPKKPLEPGVTLEQIYAFDPERPETFTPSPTINQVLAAMFVVRPLSLNSLAKYLAVDARKLSSAVEIITGHPLPKIRELWGRQRYEKLRNANPLLSPDEAANASGYADDSAIWRIDHRNAPKGRRARERKEYLEMLMEIARKKQ